MEETAGPGSLRGVQGRGSGSLWMSADQDDTDGGKMEGKDRYHSCI